MSFSPSKNRMQIAILGENDPIFLSCYFNQNGILSLCKADFPDVMTIMAYTTENQPCTPANSLIEEQFHQSSVSGTI